MALDQGVRDELRKAVQKARGDLTSPVGEPNLTADMRDALEGIYGIHRDGTFEDYKQPGILDNLKADDRARETRELLELVLPPRPTNKAEKERFTERFDDVIRSMAFTHLNRLVAFKLMEHPSRRVIHYQAVGRLLKSNGFLRYLANHPDDEKLYSSAREDVAYRNFLLWQCSEFDKEIGVLFDPEDLASRIFPKHRVIEAVLHLLNADALQAVWQDEEALGWVYQYYTPKELRDKARKESAAPRNSYELAFRNQFYTPDYVVRFLTDNTLGRLWLEMNPSSRLRQQCAFLVIRPDEQLPARPKKDPREIRVLDPACGSGHFLLYAFDLLETIYAEAWDDLQLGPALRRAFSDREAYSVAVPRLIVENNLHGIDIDKRATQIAALALFLKAKARSKSVTIERSHIVCAEPVPGDRALFDDFKARKIGNGGGVLGRILDGIWDHLQLAGEAGSLLKAEEEVARLVAREHEEWKGYVKSGAQQRLPGMGGIDFSDVPDERFWLDKQAEIAQLLRAYAEEATGAEGARRRLFLKDGVEGLRFIDAVSRSYDAVLMNPPFGDPTKGSKEILATELSVSGSDLGSAFVRAARERWAPEGYLGALLSTRVWFKPSFVAWRQAELLGEMRGLRFGAHLGGKVLDEATVSASAIVVGSRQPRATATFFRLIYDTDKESQLRTELERVRAGVASVRRYDVAAEDFLGYRTFPLAYWTSERLRGALGKLPRLEGNAANIRQGSSTADDFRFTRAWWEVRPSELGLRRRWAPFTKSSEYSPWWDDVTWVVDWGTDGVVVEAYEKAYVRNPRFIGKAGVTYPNSSVLGFNPRAQPEGATFGNKGSVAFPLDTPVDVLFGYLSSRPVEYVLSFSLGALQGEAGSHPNHYEVGMIQNLPWPKFSPSQIETLEKIAGDGVRGAMGLQATLEISHQYQGRRDLAQSSTMRSAAEAAIAARRDIVSSLRSLRLQLDDVVSSALGFGETDIADMRAEFARCVDAKKGVWSLNYGTVKAKETVAAEVRAIVSELVGISFGRFDADIVTGRVSPDADPVPFAALPAESPAMVCAGHGSTARDFHVARHGILVEDEGHPDDIVAACSQTLRAIWGDRAGAIENETCGLVGVGSLREYFRKSGKGGFWDDHVKRYSKGRRTAPLYWLLQSSKGNYSVWLYYQKLDADTLFKVRGSDYLGGKIERVRKEIAEYSVGDKPRPDLSGQQKKRLEYLRDLLPELEDFSARLKAVDELRNDRGERVGYRPDLNDGVLLNAAPLHAVIPWPKTKKHKGRKMSVLEVFWHELRDADGKYDWSSLALLLFPTRVTEACRGNKSLAIAHGLDGEFWPGLRAELRRRAAERLSEDAVEPDQQEDVGEADGDEEEEPE